LGLVLGHVTKTMH